MELNIGKNEMFCLRIWDHVLITNFLQFVVVKNIFYRCFVGKFQLLKNQQEVPGKGAD